MEVIKRENAAVNADGFGAVWYDDEEPDEEIRSEYPTIFRTTDPAWHDENLFMLARTSRATCILSHVRKSSEGFDITHANTQPFRAGSLSFMHNGNIGGYKQLKRTIEQSLRDDVWNVLQGSVDSERAFGLFLQNIPGSSWKKSSYTADDLVQGVRGMMQTILDLAHKANVTEIMALNFGVSDGKHFVATRYGTDEHHSPPTLYYLSGSGFAHDEKDGLWKERKEKKRTC